MSTIPKEESQRDWEIPEIDLSNVITEDDQTVDNLFADSQHRLLAESLNTSWDPGMPFVACTNVGLFRSPSLPPVVPDVLVSLRVSKPLDLFVKNHRSYFIWEYGKSPELVVEVVSNREGGELDRKLTEYAEARVSYYVVYDPEQHLSDVRVSAFVLNGMKYLPMVTAEFPDLGLALTEWEGSYEAFEARWLRWRNLQTGQLIANGHEVRARAEAAEARAEALAAKLRELGIEP